MYLDLTGTSNYLRLGAFHPYTDMETARHIFSFDFYGVLFCISHWAFHVRHSFRTRSFYMNVNIVLCVCTNVRHENPSDHDLPTVAPLPFQPFHFVALWVFLLLEKKNIQEFMHNFFSRVQQKKKKNIIEISHVIKSFFFLFWSGVKIRVLCKYNCLNAWHSQFIFFFFV